MSQQDQGPGGRRTGGEGRNRVGALLTFPGGHPDSDVLIAYAHGELPKARLSPIRDHLAQCPACTRLVLDLRGEGPELATDRRAQQRAGTWESLRGSLPELGSATPDRRPSTAFRLPMSAATANQGGSWRFLFPGLAIVSLGMVLLCLYLARQLVEHSNTLRLQDGTTQGASQATEPQARQQLANTTIQGVDGRELWLADLLPAGSQRSQAATSWQELSLPRDADQVGLVLTLSHAAPPEARLQVWTLGSGGTEPGHEPLLVLERLLRPSYHGSFAITFPREGLSPGHYHFKLFHPETDEILTEYRLRLLAEHGQAR